MKDKIPLGYDETWETAYCCFVTCQQGSQSTILGVSNHFYHVRDDSICYFISKQPWTVSKREHTWLD